MRFNHTKPNGLTLSLAAALHVILMRTEAFIRKNPAEALRIVTKRLSLDERAVAASWNDVAFNMALDRSLIGNLEEEARRVINTRPEERGKTMPDFFDYIQPGPLQAVKPEAVSIHK